MLKTTEVNHPLIAHYLTILRDKATGKAQFKASLEKISYVLAVEVFSKLHTEAKTVETPLMRTKGSKIKDKVVLLPILRAGLGLTDGFMNLYPDIIVSHIGLYRDEANLKPVKYYFKFPQIKDKEHVNVIIVDPMVATGGSVIFTIEYLLSMGIKNISIVSLISAPEGIKAIDNRFSSSEKEGMNFYTCKIDDKLNNKGYILPGLGDAGDRMFGT